MASNIPKMQHAITQELVNAKKLKVGKKLEETAIERAKALEEAISKGNAEGNSYTFTIVKNGVEQKVTLDNINLQKLKENLMQEPYDRKKALGLILRIFQQHAGSGKSLEEIEREIAKNLAVNKFSMMAEDARTAINARSAQRGAENFAIIKDEIKNAQATELRKARESVDQAAEDLKKANEQLQRDAETLANTEKAFSETEVVLSARQESLTQLTKRKEDLEGLLETAHSSLESAEKKRHDLLDEISRLEEEETKLNTQMSSFADEAEKTFKTSIARNSEQYSKTSKESQRAKDEINQSVRDYDQNLRTLKSQRTQHGKDLQDVQKRSKAAVDLNAERTEQLKAKQAELDELNRTIPLQRRAVSNLESQLEGVNGQITSITSKNSELEATRNERVAANKSMSGLAELF